MGNNQIEYFGNSIVDIYTLARLGDAIPASGSITYNALVRGSAGATRPLVRFEGFFVYPTITNNANGCTLTYGGIMTMNEYLEIDCSSSLSGDMSDLTINTNMDNFNISLLSINHGGLFDLEPGVNPIQITGGQNGAVLYIKFANKYHN